MDDVIDLVYNEYDGLPCFPQLQGYFFIQGGTAFHRIHYEQQDITFFNSHLNLSMDGARQIIPGRTRHPSGVNKIKCLSLPFGTGVKPVSCYARLVVHYCFTASDYAVEKR
jgi:hypothetical protein